MSAIDQSRGESENCSTSERILQLLKMHGSLQATEVGKILGITSEAARQQFIKLSQRGLVVANAEARGVGRPALCWQLTLAGHGCFPNAHAELTAQLLRTVRDKLGEPALDTLINSRAEESGANYRQAMVGITALRDRVACLAAIRNREGYMAEWQQLDEGEFLLAENHCPIGVAAKVCQGFCQAELRLFSELLQAKVERREHIVGGARRCAYRISAS
ncbi:helix-turn-helix transcriptional regulator [Serratia microhaemolytica]|uniref:helix-turn-helix transcriptional regulator n=1 Tax=Serratia microhaemolytica TaxID=2675110 RepID=UPI000FDE16FC|nr:metalloregulator ArsR/SmtB family transcription factor [Serratia microhaemolytica]